MNEKKVIIVDKVAAEMLSKYMPPFMIEKLTTYTAKEFSMVRRLV